MLPSFLSATRHVSNGYAITSGSRGLLIASVFLLSPHPIKIIPAVKLIKIIFHCCICLTKVALKVYDVKSFFQLGVASDSSRCDVSNRKSN